MDRAVVSLVLSIVGFSLLIAAPKAFADVSCQPIYGGGQSCVTTNNIVINKKVLNPQTNQFVDNLSINDPRYQPGFTPSFQISVTNTGSNSIPEVDVKDILPQFVNFGSGAGNFDTNSNTLSFAILNLAPNETRTFGITGRILNADQFPGAAGTVTCIVNQAVATINGSGVGQDNAQFCIEKPAQAPVVTTTKGGFPILPSVPTSSAPSTGPEALALIGLIPTGVAGWLLRKNAMKKEARN